MQRPTLYDTCATKEFAAKQRIAPELMRKLRMAWLQSNEPLDGALKRLGPENSSAAREYFELQPLEIVDRRASQLDRSMKFVLATRDQKKRETVLIRTSANKQGVSRNTVCVSTQIGCQAGCPFCATSRMGLVRDLNAYEIVDQVRLMAEFVASAGARIRNIVFMGMGEPLHNEARLHEALHLLTSPHDFNFSQRRITVSTVGVPEAMKHLVDKFPGVQIALSLHASDPQQRRRLVPWSQHYQWSELWEAVRYVGSQSSFRRKPTVMIEYILISGVNDSLDDATRLVALLRDVRAVVNLIPYNPIPFVETWQPTSRENRELFGQTLRGAGIPTTIRYSMGHDIQAACGQLVVY